MLLADRSEKFLAEYAESAETKTMRASRLRQYFVDNAAGNVGQAVLAAAVEEG
jgi:hypothetical protein